MMIVSPTPFIATVIATPFSAVTPPDYQPPGFQHSDVCEYSFKQEPLNIKVGDVATVRYSHVN